MENKRKLAERLLMLLILGLGILLVLKAAGREISFHRFEDTGISYEKAVVLEVEKEELELYAGDSEQTVGHQKLLVQFTEGRKKGESLSVENPVTITHNIIADKGDRLILCVDAPEGAEAYYTIYNYDRSAGIWMAAAGFLLLTVLIGKRQGLRSCLGLIFTMIMVVCYLLPHLYDGKSALASAVITIGLSSAVTCFCISGLEKKTVLNMISATLGGLTAGLAYAALSSSLHVNGCSMDEAESLILISQSTGMKLNGILFAGVMVAALGAVMDVAVSIGAALGEIHLLHPQTSVKELFRSGMNIGKDMIGTMTNTLILAFAGGSLSTLIVFISYGVQYEQLLSSNFFAVEVVQGIAGSAAVILTVPISAAVSALGYGSRK